MDSSSLQPNAKELILCHDSSHVCETYIFEPSQDEEACGYLFAAGETYAADGFGQDLLDTVVAAIQKEYYRDPARAASNSFEMALHQANLILHDTTQQGVRDWMNYFHVAVGTLIDSELHISIAGGARVLLARKTTLTNVSSGLAHFPITDPLKTFSQVASGTVASYDTLLFATVNFDSLFRPVDVTRFTSDHSAATVTSRLQELYIDQKSTAPLSLVAVSLLPQEMRSYVQKTPAAVRARPTQTHLQQRPPLVIHRSFARVVMLGILYFLKMIGRLFTTYLWPFVKRGSSTGGKALMRASESTGKNIHAFATSSRTRALPTEAIQSLRASLVPKTRRSMFRIVNILTSLPRTSKIFGVISLLLVIALAVSVILLQNKRVIDQEIQQVSETLYDARTKTEAAKTALIYDNRDQARGLLEEAQQLAEQVVISGLYLEEAAALQADITTHTDRLQRITRVNPADVQIVGDFASTVSGKALQRMFLINDTLYTYNPDTNAVIRMTMDGATEVVRQTTQGIGFLADGAVHVSDKTITFSTDPAGIALFDVKDYTLLRQNIDFQYEDSNITSIAVFGNRLYVYDATAQNVFSYNKTLRGYSSGTPWIVDESVAKDTIQSIAIDGNIFALHTNGSITRLFKGEAADFVQESVDPPLSSGTRIITSNDLLYIYVLDQRNKRVVVYTKKGALVQQLFIEANDLIDIAVDPDEDIIYALDGTRVVRVVLQEEDE